MCKRKDKYNLVVKPKRYPGELPHIQALVYHPASLSFLPSLKTAVYSHNLLIFFLNKNIKMHGLKKCFLETS